MSFATATRDKAISQDVAVDEGEDILTYTAIGTSVNTGIADLRKQIQTQFFLRNTTNREVTIQFQVSPDADFTRVHNLGTAIVLADGSGAATVNTATTSALGYVRANIVPTSSAATVGAVTVTRKTQMRGLQG